MDVAEIAKHLQGLPELCSRKPFAWLNLAPWTPQWNPKCSWDAADLLKVAVTGQESTASNEQAIGTDATVTLETSSAARQGCEQQQVATVKVKNLYPALQKLCLES